MPRPIDHRYGEERLGRIRARRRGQDTAAIAFGATTTRRTHRILVNMERPALSADAWVIHQATALAAGSRSPGLRR